MKAEMAKVSMSCKVLQQTPLRAGMAERQRQIDRETERDGRGYPQSVGLATKVHPSKSNLWMMDTRRNVLIGHKPTL